MSITTPANIKDIETPALLLDIDATNRNVHKMAAFFKDKPCKLRPHCKTHKLPQIARQQIDAGAIGITCATLLEAQVMQNAGIESILIANQIVSPAKIEKLVDLCRHGEVIACVDNLQNVRDIDKAAEQAGIKVPVLVEVNVGLDRCGLSPGKPTLGMVKNVCQHNHLRFYGLMGYEGGLFIKDFEEKKRKCAKANKILIDTKEQIETAGFEVRIVSAGGSNTYNLTGLYPGITEIQVGSYVTMDSCDKEFGLDFEQALLVVSTVISTPEAQRAVIDAGKKAISCDEGLPLCQLKDFELFKLNEEHGHIRIKNSENNLSINDKLLLIPSHGCTTIPLHDKYYLIRNNNFESVVKIDARGH